MRNTCQQIYQTKDENEQNQTKNENEQNQLLVSGWPQGFDTLSRAITKTNVRVRLTADFSICSLMVRTRRSVAAKALEVIDNALDAHASACTEASSLHAVGCAEEIRG